jgi:AcrR family transcriptional regulator
VDPARSRTPQRQRATLVNSRSRDTRQALIRAALDLWGTNDFDAAFEASTAADIAQAAGVSKGTFYFHFANKESILLEMSSSTIQAMIDQVEAGAEDDVPLRPLSEQIMTSMARRVVRAPRAAALRTGTVGFGGRASEGAVASPLLSVPFESLLRYGRDRGELSPQVDVKDGAAMLMAVTMAAIIQWGREEDLPPAWLGRKLRERAAVVLRGLGPPDEL